MVLFEEYNDNGQLKGKTNYKDGERDGLFENYHENGQLSFKRNYKDGKEHGLSEDTTTTVSYKVKQTTKTEDLMVSLRATMKRAVKV